MIILINKKQKRSGDGLAIRGGWRPTFKKNVNVKFQKKNFGS